MSFLVVFGMIGSFRSVNAQTFHLSDLSSFGISPMKVSRSGSAICDGEISDGEYGTAFSIQKGSGLYALINENGLGEVSAQTVQKNFVFLTDEYVCCALILNLSGESLVPVFKEGLACYCVSFSLGITPGDHPALRGSLLTNTYYFSASDFSCIGFTGERVARSVREKSVVSKPLSTFVEAYRDNGISTSDGVLWNAVCYCENASFAITKNGSETTLVTEVCIPLEDLLLSVHPSQRDSVRSSVKTGSQVLCGGITTRVDLNASSCLVAGVPSSVSSPISTNESFGDWIGNNYETPISGHFIPKVIPIPLYWSGEPSQPAPQAETPVVPETNVPATTAQASEVPGVSTTAASSVSPPIVTSSPTGVDEFSDPLFSENDESIFDSLPDGGTLLPEETEIIYDEKTNTTEDKKSEKTSLLSSILTTVTGAFLFGSVMILCFFFRDSEKKEGEKDSQKKKQNSRKGSSQSKKK